MREMIVFYARPGLMTDLGPVPSLALRGLPTAPVELCRLAGHTVVHEALAGALGWDPPVHRRGEVQLRSAAAIVDAALAQQRCPLVADRPLSRRALGTCRDFTVLAVALLREQGVAARARCGFATYFEDRCVDHWIVEVCDGDRWRRIDPELLGAETATLLQPTVDPLDLPEGAFLDGAQAWRRCRTGEADPEQFGIYDEWGLGFVRGNLIKDLAALNKVEMLPWDSWGADAGPLDGPDALSFLDDLASTIQGHELDEMRNLYRDPRLCTPGIVTSYGPGGGNPIDVPEVTRLTGRIVLESLRAADVLDDVAVTGTQRFRSSTPAPHQSAESEVVFFEAPGHQAPAIAEILSKTLRPGPWYADFHHHTQAWVVFADTYFEIPFGDSTNKAAALEHAHAVGVPGLQLDWPA